MKSFLGLVFLCWLIPSITHAQNVSVQYGFVKETIETDDEQNYDTTLVLTFTVRIIDTFGDISVYENNATKPSLANLEWVIAGNGKKMIEHWENVFIRGQYDLFRREDKIDSLILRTNKSYPVKKNSILRVKYYAKNNIGEFTKSIEIPISTIIKKK